MELVRIAADHCLPCDLGGWQIKLGLGERSISLRAGYGTYSIPRDSYGAAARPATEYTAWEVGTWLADDDNVHVEGYVPVETINNLISRLASGEDFDALSAELGLSWNA